jgi:hypothetical protein
MKNGEILGQQIIKKKNLFSSFVGRCKVVDEYADNGKQSSKVLIISFFPLFPPSAFSTSGCVRDSQSGSEAAAAAARSPE